MDLWIVKVAYLCFDRKHFTQITADEFRMLKPKEEKDHRLRDKNSRSVLLLASIYLSVLIDARTMQGAITKHMQI